MICPPRYATPKTGRPNLGAAIGKVARLLGTPLMGHQLLIVEVATELDAAGRLVYRQVVILLPRQSGKSTLVLAVMVAAALSRPNMRIVYACQTRLDARKRLLDDWAPSLARSPFASLMTARRGAGSEALIFENGSRIGLVSGNTRVGGHGEVLDLVVADEAWAMTDDSLETALRPTMITRPDPQFWILSSAGDDTSTWLRNKVDAGRTSAELGLTETSAYFEWSAAPDTDLADPATWPTFMPALAAGLVSQEAIAADRVLMPAADFSRCYGNWFPDLANEGWQVFNKSAWEAARGEDE